MTLVAPADPHIGRTLGGQYRIESLLGRGGMGCVYRGVQLSVNRAVAIKLITGTLPHPPEWVARFRREAEATARLSHPNSVRLFDFGVTEAEELYMVMELLEGQDLGCHLREHGPLSPLAALQITRQVLSALAEAHSLGVVHRDVKPDNVFLARVHGGDLVAKVMDFGIAGIERSSSRGRLTGAGLVVGTPAYMSPEQAQGHAFDGRTDLYSVGVMLFELLTGHQPFEPNTAVSVLVAHVTQPPKRLSDFGVKLPQHAGVQALLDGLLAKDPQQRPTISGVLDAIGTLLSATTSELRAVARRGQTGAAAAIEASGTFHTLLSHGRVLSDPSLRGLLKPTRSTAPTDSEAPMSTEAALRAALPLPFYRRVYRRVLRGSGPLVLVSGIVLAAATTLLARAWPALTAATRDAQEALSVSAATAPVLEPAPRVEALREGPVWHVKIVSKPPGASVLRDGEVLGSTPFELDVPQPIELSLVRRGYQRQLVRVTPSSDPTLSVTLAREEPEKKPFWRVAASTLAGRARAAAEPAIEGARSLHFETAQRANPAAKSDNQKPQLSAAPRGEAAKVAIPDEPRSRAPAPAAINQPPARPDTADTPSPRVEQFDPAAAPPEPAPSVSSTADSVAAVEPAAPQWKLSPGWTGPPPAPTYQVPAYDERYAGEPRADRAPYEDGARPNPSWRERADEPDDGDDYLRKLVYKPCPVGRALARAIGRLLISDPPLARQAELRREPLPYANFRALRRAYDDREVDRRRYEEVIWMLRELRRSRVAHQRDAWSRGQISESELEARIEYINTEFWGRT
ncbi:MAG: protein kinase [Polyangiales bacterium]